MISSDFSLCFIDVLYSSLQVLELGTITGKLATN